MDPITAAARAFTKQGASHFEQQGRRALRFECENGQRTGLVKALRLWELDTDNRWPFLLYDHSYRDRDSYFDTLSKAIGDDYEQIRANAAKEGVDLVAFGFHDREIIEKLSAFDRAVLHVERAAALLGDRFAGIVVVLLPHNVQDVNVWRDHVIAWMAAPFSARIRLAFVDPPRGPLEALFGEHTARFHVDTDELFDYMKQQATHKSAGPVVQAPMLNAQTGQKLLSEDESRELRALILDGSHHAAKGRYAEAAEVFGKAREMCQRFGLRTEEATILVGMGGVAVSTQAFDKAIECYRCAAEIGEETANWQLVAHMKLAIGSTLLMQQKYLPAIEAYEVAAEAAQRARLPMLRIEALRTAGTCHVLRGARDEAIPFWQKALTEGATLDPETRRASSFYEVAEEFAVYLERVGLRQQADHIRAMAAMPGGV